MFGKIQKIHLIGIGGSGMSGIAEVLINRGYRVSGSDLQVNSATQRLASLGARIQTGHRPEQVEGAHVVVTSTAVSTANPEVARAKELGIPVIPRAEMLMELMRMKYGIAIAGAHGKTTTTSLVFSVLGAAGKDPTAVIGGRVNSLGANAKMGEGDLFIVEADESDGSFLRLTPTVAVITNIDREHMDHYGEMEHVREAFFQFANRVPFYGSAVICVDDPEVVALMPRLTRRVFTYGLAGDAHVRGEVLSRAGKGCEFKVRFRGEVLGTVRLQIPGVHNVQNALAAVAVGLECGVEFAAIKRGLEEFSGIERRFQLKGEAKGVSIYDDYAHHPREIEATLTAAREVYPQRRLAVVYQPHRFTRLQDLFGQFATAFGHTDGLWILPVYAAGEKPIEGVSSEKLVEAIQKNSHPHCRVSESRATALEAVKSFLQKGDVLITLGAGDVWKLGDELLADLQVHS